MTPACFFVFLFCLESVINCFIINTSVSFLLIIYKLGRLHLDSADQIVLENSVCQLFPTNSSVLWILIILSKLLAARKYLLTWLWLDARDVTHKNWYIRFSIIISKLKKSTIKGPKSSSWVSTYLNQQLIVSNLQNQSLTDRQTDEQTYRMCHYYNPLAHMHDEG